MLDVVQDLMKWAWERHHNVLSWYIRPLFVLPFCYFAYKKSVWGVALTVVAVVSSMFWFPAPNKVDPAVSSFLAVEQRYLTEPWTLGKIVMTTLIPAWFVALAFAFWRRSWLVGFLVFTVGVFLKLIWSFYVGGAAAWAIVAPVALGFIICSGVLLYAHRRVHRSTC